MKKFKIVSIFLLMCLMVGSLSGCVIGRSNDTDRMLERKTEELMKQMDQTVGMPGIVNYFEKKMVKKIFELRDDSDLICYMYTRNQYTGKYVYEGQCVGYGIPYSVQYTNPQRIADSMGNGGGYAILPQADPNGLFMPEGLSATWIIKIDEKTGDLKPEYWEPEIIVLPEKKDRKYLEEWSIPENY